MLKFVVFSVVLVYASAEILDSNWVEFKANYGKVYENPADEQNHYNTYQSKKLEILEHNQRYNAGKESYYKGINQFSDMTFEEVAKTSMGYKPLGQFPKGLPHKPSNSTKPLPASVDWRKKGVVSPVQNQGSCGSCWAFSAVGALEGQHALATKKLVQLSAQNLVDCTTKLGCDGCGGGWPFIAYEYISRVARGIDTLASYPYKGVDGECSYKSADSGANANGFVQLRPGDEEALKEAIANVGPLSVCIVASGNFVDYSGGILDDTECTTGFDNVNHCILAVGYGTDAKTKKDYWIVKNSYGTTFGESGYIRMSRNTKNQCGIASVASYPYVGPTPL